MFHRICYSNISYFFTKMIQIASFVLTRHKAFKKLGKLTKAKFHSSLFCIVNLKRTAAAYFATHSVFN